MSESLKDYLKKCNFSQQLQAIDSLLSKANATITFLGKRVIKIPNYTGSFSLEKIAKEILRVADQRNIANDLNTKERNYGIQIVKKLRNFYSITDSQVSHRNSFTRLLNFIRELTFFPYTPRFHAEKDGLTECYFAGYSYNYTVQKCNKSSRSSS